MSGAEAVGLILAVLPLVMHTVDSYVQGVQTLKRFRTRRYREELEDYKLRIDTQRTEFLNTLELLFDGIVDHEDEVRDLITDPKGQLWAESTIEAKLRKRLAHSYEVYIQTMWKLYGLLQQINETLGAGAESVEKLAWNDPRVIEHEWKKVKVILSTSIYAELLSKIDRLLGNLRRLTEQAERLEHVKGKRRHGSQRPLLSGHRNVRKFAKSLHNAVVRGKCWECACRHLHTVGFRLEPYPGMAGQPLLDVDFQVAPKPKFRMALFSRSTPESTELQLPWHWQEVDAEPVEFEEPAASEPVPALEEAAAASVSTTAKRVKKVQFALATATHASLSPPLQINSLQIASPISDICSTLCVTTVELRPNTPIGFILDETHGKRRHNMFLVRKLTKTLHTQSLEEVISSSWKCHRHVLQPVTGTFVFRPKERLYVAATLAASVLQLQGSWLKARWSSSDIIFPQPSEETLDSPSFAHPYISWNIGSCTNDNDTSLSNPGKKAPTRHPLIKGKALLPLGLALTELSLGQTLSSLQIPEDEHPIKAVANLTTALGLLEDVYATSGDVYGDVVNYCLSYSGGSGGGRGEDEAALDDEGVQQAIFDNVVAPLLKNLKNFEGRSQSYHGH